MGVLHSFSIKYIFYDKIGLRLFCFHVTIFRILSNIYTFFAKYSSVWKLLLQNIQSQICNRTQNLPPVLACIIIFILSSYKEEYLENLEWNSTCSKILDGKENSRNSFKTKGVHEWSFKFYFQFYIIKR